MAAATKFTPETRQTILDAIRQGCFRKEACAMAGITPKCLRGWEAEAKEQPEGEFADFVDALDEAQHYAQAKLMLLHNALATGAELPPDLHRVMNAEGAAWRQNSMLKALQFQLERGGTRPWADVRQVEVTGKDGGPLEVAAAASERVSDALSKIARRAQEDAAVVAAAAAATADSELEDLPT